MTDSLQRLKDLLQIDTKNDDTVLMRCLDSAGAIVSRYAGCGEVIRVAALIYQRRVECCKDA